MGKQTRSKNREAFDLVPVEGNPRQLRVVRQSERTEPEPEPEQWEEVQLPSRASRPAITAHVEGSYTDRAKAFSISTWQLSTVTGIGAWAFAGLGGTAMFSLAGLAWLLGGYFAVWLISFALHTFVSPEGTDLFRAASEYRLRDKASLAHAVALFLVAYVRPMIAGATPLHLIDAPTPGTGKGLLANICGIAALGRELPSTTAGKDDDEWRKRITAALMDGGTFVSIDNITQPLDSGVLASVLTQSYWQDRILGVTLIVNLPIRTIWIANGNNVVSSDEIARRAAWIRIDADSEKPWEREGFKHPNLKQWAKENRNQLVTAAITLIRAWVDKGMPDYTGKSKGSYSEWSNVLGGILETVGIPGFLANENELFATTVNESSVLTEFVKAWEDAYGMKTVTVSGDLFPLASYPDDPTKNQRQYKNLLGDVLGGGNEMSRRTKLGKLLDRNRDKVIAGCKIVKEDRTGGSGKRYRLKDVTAPQQERLAQEKQWAL